MHQGLLHCQTSYLASPGSGSHSVPVVTAGTWVPVLGDTVSEISKKFLIPGNNPLILLGISVCVMSAPEDGRCSHYETLVPNPPSFVGIQGKQRQWFAHQFRGQQVEDVVLALPLGIIVVWMLVGWKQKLTKTDFLEWNLFSWAV